MAQGKDFWHDVRVSVTKELIVKAVTYTLALPVVLTLVAAAVQPVRDWLLDDSHAPHYAVVLLLWLLLIAVAGLARLAYTLRNERNQGNRSPQVAAVEPQATPQVPARFAPESFKRTPSRCRALLSMLQRVDSRTTLQELQHLANGGGVYDVKDIVTKAQLQHDMEDAERAGIVTIERVGTLTQYFNLVIPDGRDWVLKNQEELRREAFEGVARRDPRMPGR